jgi:hypothetical protein
MTRMCMMQSVQQQRNGSDHAAQSVVPFPRPTIATGSYPIGASLVVGDPLRQTRRNLVLLSIVGLQWQESYP